MRFENHPAACAEVRRELPALAYGDLDAEACSALERHLGTCPGCAEELRGLRETRALLSRWELPIADEDPRLLARAIRQEARDERPGERARRPRARLSRFTAALAGAAAALLFTLCLLRTEVSASGGRLQVSFALPWSAATPVPLAAGSDWEMRVREIAAQESTFQVSTLGQNQAALADAYQRVLQDQGRLARAVDLARARDQQAVETRLESLMREEARENARLGNALVQFASSVSTRLPE